MNKSKQMMQTLDELELDDENIKVDSVIATDHNHKWEVDLDGNGKSLDGDHEHEVIAYLAMPSTEDGHEHQVGLPASTPETVWAYEESK